MSKIDEVQAKLQMALEEARNAAFVARDQYIETWPYKEDRGRLQGSCGNAYVDVDYPSYHLREAGKRLRVLRKFCGSWIK
jgi:hypothetical protein